MIAYNVWFSFKVGANESSEIEKIKKFMDDLKSRSKISSYRLMKNRGTRDKSKLSPYQLMADFTDGSQFSLPFTEVNQIGIHAGHHGSMIENVEDFMVDVFEDVCSRSLTEIMIYSFCRWRTNGLQSISGSSPATRSRP